MKFNPPKSWFDEEQTDITFRRESGGRKKKYPFKIEDDYDDSLFEGYIVAKSFHQACQISREFMRFKDLDKLKFSPTVNICMEIVGNEKTCGVYSDAKLTQNKMDYDYRRERGLAKF